MIGNYNGVVEDDVMFRNGTVVTENVNDRLIHEVGQSCEREREREGGKERGRGIDEKCVCVHACVYVCMCASVRWANNTNVSTLDEILHLKGNCWKESHSLLILMDRPT